MMIENCTAVILAGGESRRMGRDKAQVEFQGETLLYRAITNLSPLFAEIVLSVRQPVPASNLPPASVTQSNVMQVIDAGEGRGPMMGLVAAMEYARTDWVFVIGVDMPFVVPAVLQHMAAQRMEHDAVFAEIDGHVQPMPAFYAKISCLPAMQVCIEQGRRSLMRLIPSLNTAMLTAHDLRPFDPDLCSFTDFDTPEDLTRIIHESPRGYSLATQFT
ncbi:molybdenum cofactor guanylyltransferase [Mariprofundus ferrooxydans]|nr:molybdenum cofactor guanylyltransferase [Mariprofundus ferrooxydans]